MTGHGNNGQDKEGGGAEEWKMDNVRKNTGLVAAGTSSRIMGAHVSSLVVCCVLCCAKPFAFHRRVIAISQHFHPSNLTYRMGARR